MTITVVHLLGQLRPSGMERMLVTAAEYFRREGIHSVVVGQGLDHTYASELRVAGYDVRVQSPVTSSLKAAKEFRALVQEVQADIVHVHTERDYLRTTLVSRWALGSNGRIVRTVHNVFQAAGRWKFSRFAQALFADRLISALIAPSAEVAAKERSIFRRPRVILNWVDDVFFGIREKRRQRVIGSDDLPIAVVVGNCSPIKNHELALAALLKSSHRLVHLGDEGHASDVELALLQSFKEQGRLIDRGVRSPYSALLNADYFMMSSLHEGMPVALAEALVAGVPALVSDAPGLRWAGNVQGVSLVANNERAWELAINEWGSDGTSTSTGSLDLSAARGAREYGDTYRNITRRKHTAFFRSKEPTNAGSV